MCLREYSWLGNKAKFAYISPQTERQNQRVQTPSNIKLFQQLWVPAEKPGTQASDSLR